MTLILAAAALALYAWVPGVKEAVTSSSSNAPATQYSSTLQVPELLDYTKAGDVKRFALTAEKGRYEFAPGVASDTYGYSGSILGPTIRVSEGDNVDIAVTNKLSEQTTSHWHGAIVPGDADGGVHNIIKSGETWHAKFTVRQPAATLWYHPHQHEETARQVYNGMGGFLLVDDAKSRSLNLPSDYGVDDIPLIIQSKNLDDSGKLIPYSINRMQQVMGFEGNTVMVNAQVKPTFTPTTHLVRLRLLNGSNSDTYTVAMSDGSDFYVIATDGGFLDKPVKTNSVELPNAKRYEILVDASKLGSSASLMVNGRPALTLNKAGSLANKYSVPDMLATIAPPSTPEKIDRTFNLEFLAGGGGGMMGGGMGVFGINGQLFDMNRIDFISNAGTTEYWRVKNDSSRGHVMNHPLHIHTTQFQIVSLNGAPPPPLLQGWHDTINLKPNDEAVLAVPFNSDAKGIFMYHCHILEHEDGGMMGQFKIE